MNEIIDCLIIGHNEMEFARYEEMVRQMGEQSEPYRDLNLNFVRSHNQLYTAPELFNLYFPNEERAYPPLSLGETFSATVSYLGTYLNRRGFTFEYVNSFRNEQEELAEKLRKNNIRLIAITTTLYISVFPILEIVSFIRKYNDSAKITVGGPFIATSIRTQDEVSLQYLFETIQADFYINSSQGEAALKDIILALKNGAGFEHIDNIYYKKGNKFGNTAISEENNELEENMVDWSLFADKLGQFAAVRTAISCPFSCAFCGFPQHAGRYRTAGTDAIARELNSLNRSGKVASVNFIDDTFNVPPERFKDILRMMIQNKYQFNWHSYFRCQYADRETVELMKESGCEGVFLGIESGSPQILQNMRKSATIDEYRKGLALLKETGIITFASFIVGFPGETEETIRETVSFIEEAQPDFCRLQLWYCEPITPIWRQKERYEIEGAQFKWSHHTMNSRTASDRIEEVFLTLKNTTWLPQYNFDFVGLFHLLRRGMSLEQVKGFVEGFNDGIKEKLKRPGQRNISAETVTKIKNACRISIDSKAGINQCNTAVEKLSAEFHFD